MKIKFLMISLLGLSSVTAFAQKSELTTAQNEYNNFEVTGNSKVPMLAAKAKTSLFTAKTSIDKASTNEKTSALPLTFALKAVIYASIAGQDSVPANVTAEFNTASEALAKAKTMDTKKENEKITDKAALLLANTMMQQGVAAYQNKKYDDAYKAFNTANDYYPNDTLIMFNAAISAVNAKNYSGAIKQYNSLLAVNNYGQKDRIYSDLPNIYLANKDTAGAIKVIDEALVKYPRNSGLRRQEIAIGLQTGKTETIIGKLDDAIKNDPKNKELYYFAGLAYMQIADVANANASKTKDEAAKKTLIQTANDNYTKASGYYKQATEIDPNYFDATLSLGYTTMMPGIIVYNSARVLPASKEKEYQALLTKANAQFDLARPYLQKAVDLNPKSVDALNNLRNYYRGKTDPAHAAENTAKAADLKKQIDALNGGAAPAAAPAKQ